MGFLTKIKEMIKKPEFEPEYEEVVDHDTVMEMIDGELTEVTPNDSKVRK